MIFNARTTDGRMVDLVQLARDIADGGDCALTWAILSEREREVLTELVNTASVAKIVLGGGRYEGV